MHVNEICNLLDLMFFGQRFNHCRTINETKSNSSKKKRLKLQSILVGSSVWVDPWSQNWEHMRVNTTGCLNCGGKNETWGVWCYLNALFYMLCQNGSTGNSTRSKQRAVVNFTQTNFRVSHIFCHLYCDIATCRLLEKKLKKTWLHKCEHPLINTSLKHAFCNKALSLCRGRNQST